MSSGRGQGQGQGQGQKQQQQNLRESRKQTSRLEQESRAMEERLQDLKMLLSRDKQERSNASSANNSIWGSSKNFAGGPPNQSARSQVNPKPMGGSAPTAKPRIADPVLAASAKKEKENNFPKRIKVLKDIPIEEPIRNKVNHTTIYEQFMNKQKQLQESVDPQDSQILCGICGKKAVAVTCKACSKDLCSMCSAKFHLRGEAKKHKPIPFNPKTSATLENRKQNSSRPESNTTVMDGIKFTNVENGKNDGRSSYQGYEEGPNEYFDEEASAASFQEALNEWRKGGTKSAVRESKSVGDDTILAQSDQNQIQEINFKSDSELSYAERLLLKKSQKGPIKPSPFSNKETFGDGSPTPRDDSSFTDERMQVRNNLSGLLTPRPDSGFSTGQERVIEITEVDDSFTTNTTDESSFCSVIEPPDSFEILKKPQNHQNSERISTPQIIELNDLVDGDNEKTPRNDEPKKVEQPQNKNPEAKTIKPEAKTRPNSKKAQPKKPTPRIQKPQPSSARAKLKPSLDSQKLNKGFGDRPTSALSNLTTAPSRELSQIASRQKTSVIYSTSGFGMFFTSTEVPDHFKRSSSRNASAEVKGSSLLTVRKSKAPWMQENSVLSSNPAPVAKENFAIPNFEDNRSNEELDLSKELALLDNLPGNNETPRAEEITGVKSGGFLKKPEISRIALNDLSDDEDPDQQTLDDLEYELASNTGRLNEEGQVQHRITDDLKSVLDDMHNNSGPTSFDQNSFYADMTNQDYLSDDEDYPLSVRKL